MSNFNNDNFMQKFPINLVIDILHCETKDELPKIDMESVDYLSGVYYALGSLGNERRTNVILFRYRDHMTYDSIASVIGVTKERARQILVKSLVMLRHPSRIIFVRRLMSDIIREKDEEYTRKLESIRSEYEDKLNQIESGTDPETMSDAEKERILNIPINELELSIRAFNCLYRAKIYTVRDIMNRTDKELSKIRNLGLKSLEEIRLKLKSLGLNIPCELSESIESRELSEAERIAAHNEATAKYNMRKEEAHLRAVERARESEAARERLLESEDHFKKKVDEKALEVSKARFPEIFSELIQGVYVSLGEDEQVVSMLVKTQVINPEAALPLNLLVAMNGSKMLKKDDVERLRSLLDGSVGWDRYQLTEHVRVTKTSTTFEPTVNKDMVESVFNE